ncbi:MULTISPECIES: helix-turn-helix transcriptional regulator [Rhodococcus]|jgi:DNA-binding XRE family transcriptional regulator|uniref:helix-turn-helix domain-containing protein n=1 Tax=Rhodococcus TaxID=1827 RepID=UPI001BA856EC|nr:MULTISPECIES: helix-turn-helix transcriptional regulator [Rhodococcus]MBS2989064.1 helix-turn-helix transcriptional regulator [Rhodococcus erythropolis]MDF3318941.1 helix-turn-helix transcriptional regulator [Rhodococcus sp. C3V]
MGRQSRKPSTRSQRLAKRLAENELDFKDQLKTDRANAGLSQRSLAVKLGVAPSTISRIERDDADLTLSQIRHYAWGIGRCVRFVIEEFEPACSVDEPSVSSGHEQTISFHTTVSRNTDLHHWGRGYASGWTDAFEFSGQHSGAPIVV